MEIALNVASYFLLIASQKTPPLVGGVLQVRRIDDYDGATKQVTLDRILSFNVENGDSVNISRVAYGGATGTGGSSGPKLDD